MRHRLAGRGLGRSSSHRKALLRNQVRELIEHERIVTTEAKAKELRPLVEKMITLGRRSGLHARRRAGVVLGDRKLVRRLFEEIAPRFGDRPGGYTRIVKLGPRLGDGARMAQIELVEIAAPAGAPAAASAAAGAAAGGERPSESEAPERAAKQGEEG